MKIREDRTKVFIGQLDPWITPGELEREFRRFGVVDAVWVARNPPGFGFVTYANPRDAEISVQEMNGSTIFGRRPIRVEMAKSIYSRRDSSSGRHNGMNGPYSRNKSPPSLPPYRIRGRYPPNVRYNDKNTRRSPSTSRTRSRHYDDHDRRYVSNDMRYRSPYSDYYHDNHKVKSRSRSRSRSLPVEHRRRNYSPNPANREDTANRNISMLSPHQLNESNNQDGEVKYSPPSRSTSTSRIQS
ncbi:RNA recognition motif family protein [Cryptosporidium serpentis]